MEEFLGFDGELHGEFVHDLFGITVDDEADGVFEGDSPLLAVEELVFVDLGGCCFVFNGSRGVRDDHVREGVRTAFIAQEERVALAVVAGVLGVKTHLDESAVRVLAMSGGDTFGDDARAGVLTDVDHLRACVRLLVVIGERYGVELRGGIIAFEDAGRVFPRDGGAGLDLCPGEPCVLVGDTAFGNEIIDTAFAVLQRSRR